jgi:YVTN family beta-propeller protein
MKNKKTNLLLCGMVISILFLASCKKPKKEIPDPGQTTTVVPKRVFILNEGNFGSGNASVSMYDLTANKLYNDLFAAANSRPIGDVLQSMLLANNKAYFVLNNSNKIEITNSYPLTSVGVINGLSMPRYIVAASSSKAYVSEYINLSGGNGRISILDFGTNTITGSIPVGIYPENMLLLNGKVYVCNSGDTLISVINTSTNLVESKIKVSDGPNSIVKDANGKLWVLCGGITVYANTSPYGIISQSAGALVRIDPTTNAVEATYTFSNVSGSPSDLKINGAKNMLYYFYNNAVYSQSISATALPTTPFINRDFYGLGVDSISNIVYTGTYGFSSNQQVIRYSSTAVPLDSFTVGVGPNGFVFTY